MYYVGWFLVFYCFLFYFIEQLLVMIYQIISMIYQWVVIAIWKNTVVCSRNSQETNSFPTHLLLKIKSLTMALAKVSREVLL